MAKGCSLIRTCCTLESVNRTPFLSEFLCKPWTVDIMMNKNNELLISIKASFSCFRPKKQGNQHSRLLLVMNWAVLASTAFQPRVATRACGLTSRQNVAN